MKRVVYTWLLLVLAMGAAYAQPESVVQEGEIGITLGAAHYFGDLNNRLGLKSPGPTVGLYFKKQFGPYVAFRVAGHYAKLGYADSLSSIKKLPFNVERNLDFQNNIWELTAQGDFNFFKFIPGDPEFRFTPYVTLGAGIIKHNPYTYLNKRKVDLQPLKTEGQSTSYSTQAYSFPLGMGVKYNLVNNVNLGFEVVYRYTSTDYLDDVSTVYAPTEIINRSVGGGVLSDAYLLQDRNKSPNKKNDNDQRGYGPQKDQYVFAQFTLSFSFSSYKCADPR